MMSSLSFFPVFEHKNCTNSRFVFIKIIIELFRWNRERKLKPPSRTTTRAPGITGEEGGNSAKEKLVWRLVWAFPSSVIPRLDNNNKWNYKQRAKDKPCIHCLLGLRRYSVVWRKVSDTLSVQKNLASDQNFGIPIISNPLSSVGCFRSLNLRSTF